MNQNLFTIYRMYHDVLDYLGIFKAWLELNYLIIRYGGNDNIPEKERLKFMTRGMTTKDIDDTIKYLRATFTAKEVLAKLSITYDTALLTYLIQFTNNYLDDVNLYQLIGSAIYSETPRRAMYELLIHFEDISERTVKYNLTEAEFIEFQQWLDKLPIPKLKEIKE